MKKLSLLVFGMISTLFLISQPAGTLYNLFGENGIVMTDYQTVSNYSYASVLQNDMKIVLGGKTYYTGSAGTVSNIMITRYNSYGSVDMGFGTNGIKVLEFGGSDDYLTDIGIQADGKIVAVGYTSSAYENKTKMLALRLNTDGSLDNSFNMDGMAVVDFGEDINAYAMSMGILDDGKIIIAGYIRDTLLNYSEIAMCKLLPSGFLDLSFGYSGLINYEYNDLYHFPDELVIQNDRIVLGGISMNDDFERFVCISAYHYNGEIDYSFGGGGYTTVMLEGDAIAMGGASSNGMCLAPDGKILYTCNQKPAKFENDFAFLRLNQNGGIDYSLGTNGVLVTEMDANSYARDIITQADGKIIACGTYRTPEPGSFDFLIMRYHENGDLDTDFGTDGTGIVITHISKEVQWYEDEAFNLMFCNMDRLLVSGYGRTIAGEQDFAMACYHTGLSMGVESRATEKEMSIFPNPAQDHVSINIPPGEEIQEISIYNQNGQRLIHKTVNSTRIDISMIPGGVYTIEVRNTSGITTAKFLKDSE